MLIICKYELSKYLYVGILQHLSDRLSGKYGAFFSLPPYLSAPDLGLLSVADHHNILIDPGILPKLRRNDGPPLAVDAAVNCIGLEVTLKLTVLLLGVGQMGKLFRQIIPFFLRIHIDTIILQCGSHDDIASQRLTEFRRDDQTTLVINRMIMFSMHAF